MDTPPKEEFPISRVKKIGNIKSIPKWARIFFGFLVLTLFVYLLIFSAPANFPDEAMVQIGQGMSLHQISFLLKQQNIIRSRVAFEAFVILNGGEKHILSSDYLFENKIPVFEVARRISQGEHHTAPIVVTIPEGFDVVQISDVFALKLQDFKKDKFLEMAKSKEGYLFPDTYYFFSTDNEDIALASMTKNFNRKIMPLQTEINSSGKSEEDLIIMASVIEREAKGDEDRGVISGILWKRIRIGMALQVDAAPETYKAKGLPKHPVSNPGLESIKAAIHPVNSEYLYYLHDDNGNIHYAKTFAEHVKNKKKYLR